MKTTFTILITAVALLSTGTEVRAESESAEGRPFMGVMIDTAPLPRLLSKHLGLPFGQGLRIQNVQKGSPADEAGLERDDLIIGFQGEDVHDYKRFVEAIRRADSGMEVSVQIIHVGVRKTVKLTLRPFKGEPEWKYPREPEAVQSWRPGRFFRLKPGDEHWKEIFKDGIPPEVDVSIDRLFRELYSYHYSDGEDYTITIEGNPDDDDSVITVQADDANYRTTLGEIDKLLPEKYRESAKQAVKEARETGKWKKLKINIDKLSPYRELLTPRFEPGGQMFERIQKQMREMRRRLEELEKRHGELLERFSGDRDEKKSNEKKEPIRPSSHPGQRA